MSGAVLYSPVDSLSSQMPGRWNLGLASPKRPTERSTPFRVYIYISLKLFPCEKNYLAIKKKALMVKWVVDILQCYLMDNAFVLMIDHTPLKWLSTIKETNALLMRHYLTFQPYAFTVKHRAGKDNANTDFLLCQGNGS